MLTTLVPSVLVMFAVVKIQTLIVYVRRGSLQPI